MNKEKMGQFLIELRKEKNLTQNDLSEIFSVSPQAISKWESGNSIPDIDMLEKISKFYNVSIEEIINGAKNVTPTNLNNKDNLNTPTTTTKKPKSELTKDLFSFIFSMCFIFLFALLYILNVYSVPIFLTGYGYVQAVFTGYKLLFNTDGILTVLFWIFTVSMNASFLVNIGLWISQSKKAYYIARIVLSSIATSFAISIYFYCCSVSPILYESKYYYSYMTPGMVAILILYVVYFILTLTLPLTNHHHFFGKKNNEAKTKK